MAFSFAEMDKRQIDSYRRAGLPVENLESDLFYLAELTNQAAIEIDNYSKGEETDMYTTNRFAGILDKYKTELNGSWATISSPLWHAIKSERNKKIRYVEALGLEMKLLSMELADIKNQPKDKLKEMRVLLGLFSRKFLSEHIRAGGFRSYLAAA